MYISKLNSLMSLLVTIQVRFWETSITRKNLISKWIVTEIKFYWKNRAICHCHWQCPNPIQLKKSVQGSCNKGYERFGTTAGMQCTCISIFLLCWSVIGKVSIWQSHDLDYIICTGYKIYKDLRYFKVFECWWFTSKRLLVWPVLWCSFSWYWNQRVEYREKKFPIYTKISDFL